MTCSLRIGFDIGGTFTDFVLTDPDTGALRLHKLLTTPQDPAIGALDGLRRIIADHGAAFPDVAEIIHGTTLVTNAIIERKGATLGLVTTAGFADVLEAGTEQRYDIYDLFLTYPDPLVPRRRRLRSPRGSTATAASSRRLTVTQSRTLPRPSGRRACRQSPSAS